MKSGIKYNTKSREMKTSIIGQNIGNFHNISSLLYEKNKLASNRMTVPAEFLYSFGIRNLFDKHKIFKLTNKKLIINDDFIKLSECFGTGIKNIDNIKEYKKENNVQNYEIIKDVLDEFERTICCIENFLFERNKLFEMSILPKKIAYKFEEDELSSLYTTNIGIVVSHIMNISEIQEKEIYDYFPSKEKFISRKRKEKIFIPKIHNYNTLRDELFKMIESDTEYISSSREQFRLLKNKEILTKLREDNKDDKILFNKYHNELSYNEKCLESVNRSIDCLNNSHLFNKEIITNLYIRLDNYVKRENCLNSFIYNVLKYY